MLKAVRFDNKNLSKSRSPTETNATIDATTTTKVAIIVALVKLRAGLHSRGRVRSNGRGAQDLVDGA